MISNCNLSSRRRQSFMFWIHFDDHKAKAFEMILLFLFDSKGTLSDTLYFLSTDFTIDVRLGQELKRLWGALIGVVRSAGCRAAPLREKNINFKALIDLAFLLFFLLLVVEAICCCRLSSTQLWAEMRKREKDRKMVLIKRRSWTKKTIKIKMLFATHAFPSTTF